MGLEDFQRIRRAADGEDKRLLRQLNVLPEIYYSNQAIEACIVWWKGQMQNKNFFHMGGFFWVALSSSLPDAGPSKFYTSCFLQSFLLLTLFNFYWKTSSGILSIPLALNRQR
jgi:hypothetical protein